MSKLCIYPLEHSFRTVQMNKQQKQAYVTNRFRDVMGVNL